MIPEAAAWLIFFLPLGSFVVIGLIVRPFFNRHALVAGYMTIAAVGASLVLSLWALGSVVSEEGAIEWISRSWLSIGAFDLDVGILMDPLTAIMLVVATSVSLMVQIYSVGYMKGDPGYARYYAYMSLFTASMIGLVLASNIIQLYVFWELVGLSSYLLIGFWFTRPAAAAAAKKAFIVTRIGDFGFLLAIMYLFFNRGAFEAAGLNPLMIADIYAAVDGGVLTSGVAMWIALGIFAGAVGKSAQFPLHSWLPDAMEGPTPVSALIHAATMVAAGVFLVARFFPVFELSDTAMNTVAIVGGFTAIFAASMGLVMNDIKRVLAYSTVSQLGFMMLALGVGAYGAAIFHLFAHAFFKALLFLGAGSVNHASGTFDMRYMGGLRKAMPWTYLTFAIGGLSLAGIFPLAGFWSKDEILSHAWLAGGVVGQTVFWLALVAVFMTSFYIFRAIFMTFEGEFKGGAESDPDAERGAEVHLAESPMVMVAPLIILAVGAVLAGFFVNPLTDLGLVPVHWLTEFLGHGPVDVMVEDFNVGIAAGTSLVALAGIFVAYDMYFTRRLSADRLARWFKAAYVVLDRKYYFDEGTEKYLVTRGFYGGLSRALDWADKSIVDKAVNWIGLFSTNVGGALRQVQTGQLQGYGMAISAGVLAIVGLYLFFL
ncbi:MAG: NADH-quinone oxidoreductase subunit L [Chloroflexi bacterium]|nr:NADH-quinone oxidoreductase subunit L [Chloroflexota bacterium]